MTLTTVSTTVLCCDSLSGLRQSVCRPSDDILVARRPSVFDIGFCFKFFQYFVLQ